MQTDIVHTTRIHVLGIDLAKNSFSLHGVNAHGKCVLSKSLSRAKLAVFVTQLPPCLIGMEACSGAHHWARVFTCMGHTVRIMAPRFVAPYRKGGKNDGNDAEAICEAVSRPSMRFVPVKSADQQAMLCLHRVRSALIKDRTAMINQLRGLLSEFGIVMPKGRYPAQAALNDILHDTANGIPPLALRLLRDVHARLLMLNAQLLDYDRELEQLARHCPLASRLMRLPGVGPLTATALVASVVDPALFRNGRQFAAWLGLVPRQFTTGGVVRLGRITKQGDTYLRMLLIHGTRAVLAQLKDKHDALSEWARALMERRGYKRTCVALAAKHARIIWALLMHKTDYTPRSAAA